MKQHKKTSSILRCTVRGVFDRQQLELLVANSRYAGWFQPETMAMANATSRTQFKFVL